MKTLLLLRHAKSSWDDESLADHDRPLNRRGQRDAPKMGEFLVEEDMLPDVILCSTARRARDTAGLLMDAAGFGGRIAYLDDLYHANPEAMLAAVGAYGGDADSVMLIGHNPGMEDLLYGLLECAEPFPTAALAHIEIGIDSWGELERGNDVPMRLVRICRPRQLW